MLQASCTAGPDSILPQAVKRAHPTRGRGILGRASVSLELSTLQALGVTLTEAYKRVKVEEPAKRKGGIIVNSVAELMDKLRNEAKVL